MKENKYIFINHYLIRIQSLFLIRFTFVDSFRLLPASLDELQEEDISKYIKQYVGGMSTVIKKMSIRIYD